MVLSVSPEHVRYWDEFTRREHYAIYALAVYDWLISLDREVELIQSNGLRPAKLAFLLCRYWPLITYPITTYIHTAPHSRESCQNLFRAPMFLESFNFLAAALVMSIRIHAFTGQRRATAVLLALGMAGITIFQLFVASSRQALAPFGTGCLPMDTGEFKFLAGFFIAPLGFDLCALLIMGLHVVRATKFKQLRSNDLTKVFLRDGLVYFLAVAGLHLVNITYNLQQDKAKTGLGVPLGVLLPNILTCRMVLNLRSAIEQDRLDCTPVQTAASGDTYKSPAWPVEHHSTVIEWGYKASDLPLPLHEQRSGQRHPPEQPAVVNQSPASQYSIPIIIGSSLPDDWAGFTSADSETSPQAPWRPSR